MSRTCTICGRAGHRASKCPRRPQIRPLAAVVALGLLSGCAIAVPADTLCQLPRPFAKQKAAHWDSRCTAAGWIRRAAK